MSRAIRFIGGLALLVIPYLLLAMLKTGLFEHPLPEGMSHTDFVYEVYIRPMWLEVTVVALALIVGDMIGERNWAARKEQVLTSAIILSISLLICLVFVTFVPKIGLEGDFFTVWIPLSVSFGAASLVVYSLTPA
jgi:hypothetical protein